MPTGAVIRYTLRIPLPHTPVKPRLQFPPAGQPVLCDVLLADAAGTQRVLPYPDEALTAQNIQEGDTVALLPDGTLKKLRCI